MSGMSEIADCPPSPIADDPSVRPLPTFSPSHWTSLVHPTPVLLPGKSHGRRNLVGCSPWGRKESDPTEELPFLPFLPPPVSHSPCLFTRCQPPYACSCTVPLCFSRCYTVRLKMFSLFCVFAFYVFFFYVKNTIKSITVPYYIADCVSQMPRLTLLDLQTHWTYDCALRTELVHM